MEIEYALQPKQAEAFFSYANEILYGGAAGGGKSHLMRVASIYWCLAIKGLQVYLFRRVSDDLVKNHMEGPTGYQCLLQPLVDEKLVRINHSKNWITFPGGSKIYLCHCQHEKDRYKYQGAEIHVLMIDELTHFTNTIYYFLRSRVRMTAVDLPDEYKGLFPRILNGSNPGNIGHNWVKMDFVDNAPPMELVQMPKEKGGMLRQYIPARLDDNQILMKTDPNYDERLSGFGNEALVKAMRDGDWNIVAGGAFSDLWSEKHHIIKAFDIPSSWDVFRSFDWGSSHPFSVGWWAVSDGTTATMRDGTERTFSDGTMFRIVEFYGWSGEANQGCRMQTKDIAEEIKQIEEDLGYPVIAGPADSSIFDVDPDAQKSIADTFEDNGVEWVKSNKKPGSRINGLNLFRDMLKESLSTPMEGPGVFIFDNCRQFIRTVPTLPLDEKKIEDINTEAEDHIWDETRYMALHLEKTTIFDVFGIKN